MRTKSTGLLILCLWGRVTCYSWAQDFNWLLKSDYTANEEIVSLLKAGHLSSSLEIINQVGQRADLDFNLLIRYLAKRLGQSNSLAEEVLLEKLLSLVFAPARSDESKRQAALINASSLDEVYKNFHILKNCYLQSQLLQALGYQPSSPYLHLIAEEASRLVSAIKKGELVFSPAEQRKAQIILEVIEKLKRPEFIFICVEFNKWLPSPALARKAREVAQALSRL